MKLRDHVIVAVTAFEEEERIRRLYGSHDKWVEAVDLFFFHVTQKYLVHLVHEGLVSVSRIGGDGRDAGKPDIRLHRLDIHFGSRCVRMVPVFSPTADTLGYVDIRLSPQDGREDYVICDLTRGWLAPAREVGLRGALSRYLPERLVPLDEGLFHDIIVDLVKHDEPIFTYDKERIRDRFSLMLDEFLDPSRERGMKDVLRDTLRVSTDAVRRVAGAAMRSRQAALSGPPAQATQLLPDYRKRDDGSPVA